MNYNELVQKRHLDGKDYIISVDGKILDGYFTGEQATKTRLAIIQALRITNEGRKDEE